MKKVEIIQGTDITAFKSRVETLLNNNTKVLDVQYTVSSKQEIAYGGHMMEMPLYTAFITIEKVLPASRNAGFNVTFIE